jgi:hypothetical protein
MLFARRRFGDIEQPEARKLKSSDVRVGVLAPPGPLSGDRLQAAEVRFFACSAGSG